MAEKEQNNPEQTPTFDSKTIPAEFEVVQPTLTTLQQNARYEDMQEFARGGLGRIIRAKDKRLGRPVAIKELLKNKGPSTQRFIREALITARLEHPSIVPVHDAGKWPDGSPFFSMKMIQGRSLKDVLDSTTSLKERLALLGHMLDACEAIAYAHEQKIIHRDIKPHNVLVGAFGETVVIDWGLAKEVGKGNDEEEVFAPDEESLGSDKIGLTNAGAVMGTPAYMPPEQARGEQVDERADVYSLGALLYYFLTGLPPYRATSAKAILKQVLAGPPQPVTEFAPEAPKDLVAITEKAMARDVRSRYQNAKELAVDLRKYQVGGLVGAHTYTSSELVLRWLRRNRAAVSVASILLLFIIVAGTYSIISIIEARDDARSAQEQEHTMREAAETQQTLAQQKQREAEEASNQLRLLQARSFLSSDPAATLSWLQGLSTDASGWSYARLLAQETQRRGAARYVFRGHTALVNSMAFSPDGNYLASASKDGTVRLWDIQAKKAYQLKVSPEESMLPAAVTDALFSPHGKQLAAVNSDGHVTLWALSDALQGKEGKHIANEPKLRRAIAFSPDGNWLAISGAGTILLQNTQDQTTKQLKAEGPQGFISLAFHPDKNQVAALSLEQTVLLWDISNDAPPKLLQGQGARGSLHFSGDGKNLAAMSMSGALLWSLEDLQEATLLRPEGFVAAEQSSLELSPDNQHIAMSGVGGDVFLWDSLKKQWRTLKGGSASLKALQFSPDGKTLAAASTDRFIWLWDLQTGQSHTLKGHIGGVQELTFSPDGKTLASVCDYNAVRLWSILTQEENATSLLLGHSSEVMGAAFSHDGEKLYSIDRAGAVWRWTLPEQSGSLITQSAASLRALSLSKDGRLIAFAGEDPDLRVLDTTDGKITFFKGASSVKALAFSPDGKFVAVSSDDNAVRLWNLEKKSAEIIARYDGGVLSLAFSPDGKLLLMGGADRLIHMTKLGSSEVIHVSAHLDHVTALSFSADGKLFASGSTDKSIRVFRVENVLQGDFKPAAMLDGHSGQVNALSFTKEATQLLSTASDKTTKLWDIESAQYVSIEEMPTQGYAAVVSPNSEFLVSSNEKNAIVVWHHPALPFDAKEIKAWLSEATTAKVGKDYKLRSNQ